jgi:hypothetical protein
VTKDHLRRVTVVRAFGFAITIDFYGATAAFNDNRESGERRCIASDRISFFAFAFAYFGWPSLSRYGMRKKFVGLLGEQFLNERLQRKGPPPRTMSSSR